MTNRSFTTRKIVIFDESYSLTSDESEEQIVTIAQLVDTLMRKMAMQTGNVDAKKVAVLTALSLAHEMSLLQKERESERVHHRRLIDQIESVLSF